MKSKYIAPGPMRYRASLRVVDVVHEATLLTADKVVDSAAVAQLFRPLMTGLPVEEFWIACLDSKNRPVCLHMVSRGTMGSSLVHPRETFRVAVFAGAASIIVAHNHPSGDSTPSAEDRRVTDRLRKAGELLGIPVLDHVVIGEPGYWSFADHGW
jgi:DNA repair protein RadC